MSNFGSTQNINEQLHSLSLKIDQHTNSLVEKSAAEAAPPINRENTNYLQGLLAKLSDAVHETDIIIDLDREMKYGMVSIPDSVQLSEEQRNLKDSLISLFKNTCGAVEKAEETQHKELELIAKILETSFIELESEFDKQVSDNVDQHTYNHEYARYQDHHHRLSVAEESALENTRHKYRDSKDAVLSQLKTQCLHAASDDTAASLPMNVTTARFFRDLYSETRDMIITKKITET